MLDEHSSRILNSLLVSSLRGIDENEEGNSGVQEGVANVIDDGSAQMTAQVFSLVSDVDQCEVQLFRWFLATGLQIVIATLC